MKEEIIKQGQEELALAIFDGDTEKAQKLLLLIKSFLSSTIPPEFKNLVTNLPEETCKWCTEEGECLFFMPDSMFCCSGKCKEYEEK